MSLLQFAVSGLAALSTTLATVAFNQCAIKLNLASRKLAITTKTITANTTNKGEGAAVEERCKRVIDWQLKKYYKKKVETTIKKDL